jgi:glycosyltransferase involved in cell wall biosynthesis
VEIIVVDDGSPDDTAAVAERYADRGVKLIQQANAGLASARNAGILFATGKFLLFLDADDYLLPDTLQRFLDAAGQDPAGDVYFGSWDVVEEDGRVVRRTTPEITAGENFLHRYLRGNVFPCHAAIVRRAALAKSNLFDTQLRAFEDWDLWIRLAASGARFVPADGAVVAYRQLPGSMSKHYDRMRQAGAAVMAKAIAHPNCPACHHARMEGRRSLRYHLYVNLLEPELRALRANEGIVRMMKRLWQISATDPGFAVMILRLWTKKQLTRCRKAFRFRKDSTRPATA